jgi:hypothetical protein
MKTLIPFLLSELAAGRPAALATVLVSRGSAPRGAGACMALSVNGTALGTVGGGVLEHRALRELRALLALCPPNGEAPSGTLPADGRPFPLPPGNPSRVEEYASRRTTFRTWAWFAGATCRFSTRLHARAAALFPRGAGGSRGGGQPVARAYADEWRGCVPRVFQGPKQPQAACGQRFPGRLRAQGDAGCAAGRASDRRFRGARRF